MKRYALLLLLALTFSGCGPMYNTTYQFEPPKGSSGQACIFQCETVRGQCLQIQEMQADNCRNRSQSQQFYCEQRIRSQYGREPKWYECGSESCSTDSEECDRQYRACYQACGGRVIPETVCVANCPPPATDPEMRR